MPIPPIPRATESSALLSLLSFCYPGAPNLPAPSGPSWVGGWKTCQKGNAKIMFDPTRFDLPGLFLVLPAEDSEEVGDALIRRIRLYECWIFMRRGANDDLNAYPSGDLIDDVQDAIDWGLQALNPDGTTGGRV